MGLIRVLDINENGTVVVTKYGKKLPENIALRDDDHQKGQPVYHRRIKWTYYVYCESIYKNYTIGDRKKQVAADQFSGVKFSLLEKDEKAPLVKAFISKIDEVEKTPAQRLIEATKKQIQDCLDFYLNNQGNQANFDEITDYIKRSSSLLDVLEKLEKREAKEKELLFQGGEEPELFELPDITHG